MNQTRQRDQLARVIALQAPPSPKCFDSRDRWVIYLESAQAARKPGRQPFDDGIYRPLFNFCTDCSPEWKAQMVAELRCAAEAYIATLTAGQAPALQPVETSP